MYRQKFTVADGGVLVRDAAADGAGLDDTRFRAFLDLLLMANRGDTREEDVHGKTRVIHHGGMVVEFGLLGERWGVKVLAVVSRLDALKDAGLIDFRRHGRLVDIRITDFDKYVGDRPAAEGRAIPSDPRTTQSTECDKGADGLLMFFRDMECRWMWGRAEMSWWMYLVSHAATSQTRLLRFGAYYNIDRGQIALSIRGIKDEWRYTGDNGDDKRPGEKRIMKFLDKLESDGMIRRDNDVLPKHETLITVVDYDMYTGRRPYRAASADGVRLN